MHAKLIRLRAQIIKELLCILRDPKTRLVLIGPPLAQLFIFAFAVTLEVKNIEVAVLNHDAGGAAVELVQQLQSSDLIQRIHGARSEGEIAGMIDRQQVIAGFVIPETFSRDVAAGETSATLPVVVDDHFIGVSALAADGSESLVTFGTRPR